MTLIAATELAVVVSLQPFHSFEMTMINYFLVVLIPAVV
jgi:hypothetical protein